MNMRISSSSMQEYVHTITHGYVNDTREREKSELQKPVRNKETRRVNDRDTNLPTKV